MSDDMADPVEVDPFDAEIAALGPPPGMGCSAAESDEYYAQVNEIESRRFIAGQEATEAAQAEAEGDDGTGRALGT